MLYSYRPQTACNTKCEICSFLQGSRRRSLFSKYILKNTVFLLLKQRDILAIFNIQCLKLNKPKRTFFLSSFIKVFTKQIILRDKTANQEIKMH